MPKTRYIYEGKESEDEDDIIPSNHCKPETSGSDRNIPNGLNKNPLQKGELAEEGERFCSFQAVQKYLYDYVDNRNRNRVHDEFFNNEYLYKNAWDFFYLHCGPSELSEAPILLVPTVQFELFLAKINNRLNTNLSIPNDAEDAYNITFVNDGTPRPRYLGRATSKDVAQDMRLNIPASHSKLDGKLGVSNRPTDSSLKAFQDKIALLTKANKEKSKKNKEKRKQLRFEKHKAWNRSTKRVQRYLGLRVAGTENTTSIGSSLINPDSGCKDYYGSVITAATTKTTTFFDPEKVAVFPQEGSVVFICVDIEAYERDPKIITEIGFATLDTRDIVSMPPGERGTNWMEAIRPRHFRINEYKNLHNYRFVSGCADRFDFGTTEFINLTDAPHVISTCFKHPFSKIGEFPAEEQPKRNIVLVGHDIDADIRFLRTLGYDVNNLSNLQESTDTAVMHRYLKREQNPRNLGTVLADLGIIGWNLHNAGNDAVYTLQAMIAIAIKQLEERQKQKEVLKEEKAPISESLKDATKAALDTEEGWSSAGNNSDGGHPTYVAPPQNSSPKKRRKEPLSNATTIGSNASRLYRQVSPLGSMRNSSSYSVSWKSPAPQEFWDRSYREHDAPSSQSGQTSWDAMNAW